MIQKENVAIGHIATLLMRNEPQYFGWQRFFKKIGVDKPPIELETIQLFKAHIKSNMDNTRKLLQHYYYKDRENFTSFLEALIVHLRHLDFNKINIYLYDLGYEIDTTEERKRVILIKDMIIHALSQWEDIKQAYLGVTIEYQQRQTDWPRKSVEGLRNVIETFLRRVTGCEGKEPRFTHSKKNQDSVINRYLDQIGRQGFIEEEHKEDEGRFLCGAYAFLSTYGTHSKKTKEEDAEIAMIVGQAILKRSLKQMHKIK